MKIDDIKELFAYINNRHFIQVHYRYYDDEEHQIGRPNYGRIIIDGGIMKFEYADKDAKTKTTSEYTLPEWVDIVENEMGAITFGFRYIHRGFEKLQ